MLRGSDAGGRTKTRRIAVSVLRGVGFAVALYVTLGLVVRYTDVIDRLFIFFPERELVATPRDHGLDYEDVEFSASDGVSLHGWYVPGRGETTLVWFHGNAGNISHRVDNLQELHHRLGVNVFIFDYRGYGRSEGRATEEGAYLDARAAVEYVASRGDVDPERLVLFGRSLGCAMAVEAALPSNPYAVILESPFTSARAMARHVYRFLPGIGLFVPSKFDCTAKIAGVTAPVMVLHGDRDELVPYRMGRELFDAARPPKRFYTIEGAGHNDTYMVGGTAYYEALADFIADPTGDGA
jgi:fermentation-respiration switch protein FrsA (DUF1100 family)